MFRRLTLASVAAIAFAGAAQAATLSGIFDVTVVNVTNLSSSQSQASLSNFEAAKAGTIADSDSVIVQSTFTFDGALDFETTDGTDATSIANWLSTSSGSTVTWTGTDIGATQLSKPNINSDTGTATTTFFYFELASALGATDFTVRHDDGMTIYQDKDLVGGRLGPNAVKTTEVSGFEGGMFSLLYVATNGDPSILHVNATPVPVPASLPLLLAGMGGLAIMRRRRAKA